MPSTSRGSGRDFAALEARRYEAARLFARGESQAAVARALGATRAAAHRWYHAWQDEGRTALKAAGRAGRKPRLEAPQLARVEAALLKGPGLMGSPRSCGRCRAWPRSSSGSRACGTLRALAGTSCGV